MGYGDGRVVEIEGGLKDTYSSVGLVDSGVIKSKKGVLFGLSGYNNSASDQYIHIFNSPTVPADTGVPEIIISVPANSNFSFDAGVHGYKLSNGISFSNSSTLATKTIGSADCWINAIYK